MSKFNPNLTDAVAGIPVLEDDDVIFEVTGIAKPFHNEADEANERTENFGISLGLKLVACESDTNKKYIGRTFPQRFYLHNDGSLSVTKRFVMACYGYSVNDEEAYNEKFAEADASIDPDAGEVGELYAGLRGKNVAASVKSKARRDDPNLMQNTFNWRPVA